MPQMKCNYVYVAGLNKGNVCNKFCRSGKEKCCRHSDEGRAKHNSYNKKASEKTEIQLENRKITNKKYKEKKKAELHLPEPTIECDCGSMVTESHKSRHEKCQKHQQYLKDNKTSPNRQISHKRRRPRNHYMDKTKEQLEELLGNLIINKKNLNRTL